MALNFAKTEYFRLECDYCGDEFIAPVSAEDLNGLQLTRGGVREIDRIDALSQFDPKTASALCPECGQVMARLMTERDQSRQAEAAYGAFVAKVGQSTMRKLGLTPARS